MKDENLAFAIRGKTDRRRTRDAKKKIEKQMIQLDKKASQLYYLERNLGNELLETPYQKGFKRFFEVRKDITQTKYVDFYTELLAIINTTQYSLRKDFKKSKKIKRKRVLVETTQALKSFSEWEFKKIPEKFKFHFIKIEEYSALTKSIEINYVFIESWKYNLKVVPNIITHRKKLDNELASEIKNI